MTVLMCSRPKTNDYFALSCYWKGWTRPSNHLDNRQKNLDSDAEAERSQKAPKRLISATRPASRRVKCSRRFTPRSPAKWSAAATTVLVAFSIDRIALSVAGRRTRPPSRRPARPAPAPSARPCAVRGRTRRRRTENIVGTSRPWHIAAVPTPSHRVRRRLASAERAYRSPRPRRGRLQTLPERPITPTSMRPWE
jgi:hypothetical protein